MEKRRKGLKIVLAALVFIAVFLMCLAIWNAVAAKNDAKAYPPEGRMVEVGGHKMHVYVTGERKNPEEPAIVMISGLGTPSPTADFYPVWSMLSADHMVAVLERPGYGWSDETDAPRTLTNIVAEDREALEKAGIAPPYLLVAHSLGGIEAHLFTDTYPVSGLLLIDSMSPELYLHYGEAPVPTLTKIAPALRFTGLLRLTGTLFQGVIEKLSYSGRNDLRFLDEHYKALDRAMTLNAAYGKNVREETERRVSNAALANEVELPENLPVILVIPRLEESKNLSGYGEYMDIQNRWISQSSNGRIVDGCETGHYVHQYAPELIVGLITELLSDAR